MGHVALKAVSRAISELDALRGEVGAPKLPQAETAAGRNIRLVPSSTKFSKASYSRSDQRGHFKALGFVAIMQSSSPGEGFFRFCDPAN